MISLTLWFLVGFITAMLFVILKVSQNEIESNDFIAAIVIAILGYVSFFIMAIIGIVVLITAAIYGIRELIFSYSSMRGGLKSLRPVFLHDNLNAMVGVAYVKDDQTVILLNASDEGYDGHILYSEEGSGFDAYVIDIKDESILAIKAMVDLYLGNMIDFHYDIDKKTYKRVCNNNIVDGKRVIINANDNVILEK
jgi:hypothetical protein